MMLSRGNGEVLVEFQPMSPDEIQRMMQFLLTQQAQFAADFERLTVKTGTVTDAVLSLTGIVGRIAERQEEGFAELREYIKTVESHLNVVIEIFERHLREDHGQRPS